MIAISGSGPEGPDHARPLHNYLRKPNVQNFSYQDLNKKQRFIIKRCFL